jgi:hypothetical protein
MLDERNMKGTYPVLTALLILVGCATDISIDGLSEEEQSILDSANALYAEGLYGKALLACDSLPKETTAKPEVHRRIVECLLRKAKRMLRDGKPQVAYKLARAAEEMGHPRAARIKTKAMEEM